MGARAAVTISVTRVSRWGKNVPPSHGRMFGGEEPEPERENRGVVISMTQEPGSHSSLTGRMARGYCGGQGGKDMLTEKEKAAAKRGRVMTSWMVTSRELAGKRITPLKPHGERLYL